MEKLNEQLEALNLPVGWTVLETEQCLSTIPNGNRALWVGKGKACIIPADVPEGIPAAWGGYAVSKIAGWLISGLAAVQGAPFWFDMLKKFTNVRSSGKNPAEEKPKKED
ncbi:MAG: hypothetical protein KAX26_11960 [Anaerolineae bacterium]|nr:hypothetical protein [Anaerolineae bacterium]